MQFLMSRIFLNLLCFALVLLHAPVRGQSVPGRFLKTAQEVLRLTPPGAGASVSAVKLKGVVLFSDEASRSFHLHDGTGTLPVSVPRGAGMELPLRGQEVQVEATTASYRVAGNLHVRLNANKIVVGPVAAMPQGEAISLATLNTFSHFDQWVSVDGFVMEWSYHSPLFYVKLISRDAWSTVVVRVPDASRLPKNMHGARVRVTGIAGGNATLMNALTVPDLADLEFLSQGSAQVFDAPLVPVSDVMHRKIEAGKRVRVRGTVITTFAKVKIIIQGEGGAMTASLLQPEPRYPGVEVPRGDAGPLPELKPGDEVELEGSIFEPNIGDVKSNGLSLCHVRVTGKGEVPKPESVEIETLLGYRNEDHWVTIEGMCEAWTLQNGVMMFAIAGPRASITFSVHDWPLNSFPARLHGARIRFTGVSCSLNQLGKGSDFVVPGHAFLDIRKPGTADPFDVPERSAADIAHARAPAGERVKTRGVLVGRFSDAQVLYVRGSDSAMCVQLRRPWHRQPGSAGMFYADFGPWPEMKLGDEVEVVGTRIHNDGADYEPYDLTGAGVRVLGHSAALAAAESSLGNLSDGARTSDLVKTRGRLVAVHQVPQQGGDWRTTMMLEVGGKTLPVIYQGPGQFPSDLLKLDDELSVQGVMVRAIGREPRQLVMGSAGDVKSLGLAPVVWARRLWLWGGGVLVVLIALLAWIWVLRRSGLIQARVAVELKAANEAARESEQRWKLLFEQSPLSVQIFAPDGQAKRFNQAWKNLFRLNDEQGFAFNVLKDPDLNASGAVNLIRKAFEGEVVHVPPVPFPVNTDPPEHRWIGGVLYPVKNDAGEIMEVVTVHNDITEMKRAEEAMIEINQTLEKRVAERTEELERAQADLQRSLEQERELGELKSRFVTTVSHEFRTPLGIIMSAVELLQHYSDRLPDEEKMRQMQEIQSSTKHMGGLMEQVLLLGRAEAGKLTCKPLQIDLAEFSERIIDETQSISNRKCPITLVVENDLADARADEALLRHILGNLVTNAVKYSPAGEEVTLRLRREGPNAVISVGDRGIGIPEKDRERLFEAFHRCSNVGDTPGTGLGLVIVKRCVDLHSGTIEIESDVGKGTTFIVRLPAFV